MLERVDCDEDTTLRLSECRRSVSDPTPGVISEYCTHSKDAGVICRGMILVWRLHEYHTYTTACR